MKKPGLNSILAGFGVYFLIASQPVWAAADQCSGAFSVSAVTKVFGPNDGALVIDPGRRDVSKPFRDEQDESYRRYADDPSQSSLAEKLHTTLENQMRIDLDHTPDVSITPNGFYLVREIPTELRRVRLVLKDPRSKNELRSTWIDASQVAGMNLTQVSPDNRFAIFSRDYTSHVVVISLETGKTVLVANHNPDDGIRITFSGKNLATLTMGSRVSTVALNKDKVSRLVSSDFDIKGTDLAEGKLIIPISSGDLGDVHFVPSLRSYVSFFFDKAPALQRFRPEGKFQTIPLVPPNLSYTPTRDHALLARLEQPRYSSQGLVDEKNERVFAVRSQGHGSTWKESIDIFSLETLHVHATINTTKKIAKMAISPNGRLLAVSFGSSGGVHVYDLSTSPTTLFAKMDFANYDGASLAFTSDNSLLAGSSNHGILRSYSW